jgi:flavin reductase (DIM6/NTAB) family NADH-FMN oxidoreductase RutF
MFYTTESNRHGLAHDPFKAIVSPRPIGWIGSKGRDGSINLAPYSFFNAVADRPKLVMFSSPDASTASAMRPRPASSPAISSAAISPRR